MVNKKSQGVLHLADALKLIEKKHPRISIQRQCKLLKIGRGSIYYQRKTTDNKTKDEMQIYAQIYAKDPCVGTRRMPLLISEITGSPMGRKRATRLRNALSLKTLYPYRDTSKAAAQHPKYPYLLKELKIKYGQVTSPTYPQARVIITCAV